MAAVNAPAPPAVAFDPSARLAAIDLFSSLDQAALAAIAPRFEARAYPRETVIFAEGEPPRFLHVVTDGYVKLVKHSEDGRDLILHIAVAGDLIGGVSAFGRRPHPFTAQAMTPAATWRVAGPDFAAIMEAHPPVARRALGDLVERLTEAHETMKSLAVERAERRVARQVVKLAARAGRPTPRGLRIDLPLARQDIADMAGTTVETAIRVISRWRRAGWIATVDGCLVVVDPRSLAAIADGVER